MKALMVVAMLWWVCLRGTPVFGPYADPMTCYSAMHEIMLAMHTPATCQMR